MKKPYRGILKEPWDLEDLKAGPRWFLERIAALYDHYELTITGDNNFLKLALALAEDHVPGFKIKPTRRGKRPTRVVTDIITLVALGRAAENGESVNNAARLLAKKHPEWGLRQTSIRQR